MAAKKTRPEGGNHDRFVTEYLVDLNATKAAERAGYSKKSAASQGSRLLRNRKVGAAIAAAKAARAERVEVKQDDTLRQLVRIASSDVRKMFDADGRMIAIKDLPDDVAPSIASIEVEELFDDVEGERVHVGQIKKIKFWDKVKAIELSMKHLGLLIERHKVEHTVMTLEQMVLASMKGEGEESSPPSEPTEEKP